MGATNADAAWHFGWRRRRGNMTGTTCDACGVSDAIIFQFDCRVGEETRQPSPLEKWRPLGYCVAYMAILACLHPAHSTL
jgi:hypothetical protein